MNQDSPLRRFDFGPFGNRLVPLSGVLLVFGLAALALSSTWFVAGLAIDVWRARTWTVTQATVLHVSLSAVHEPRRLGYYDVRIKYRYLHGEGSYEANRLVFTGQTTETVAVWNGKWLSAVVEYIEKSRLEGRPVPVFVNPANPAEAVVFRDMVWGNYLLLSLLTIALAWILAIAARTCLSPILAPRTLRWLAFGIAIVFPAATLVGAGFALLA